MYTSAAEYIFSMCVATKVGAVAATDASGYRAFAGAKRRLANPITQIAIAYIRMQSGDEHDHSAPSPITMMSSTASNVKVSNASAFEGHLCTWGEGVHDEAQEI